ncbi:MAG TPA: lactonase family protein [Bryocella sp.]|nr:lactonase family protein [Bryocella sp.]
MPAHLEARNSHKRPLLVFVGTMGVNAQGIYAYRFNPATGQATFLGLAAVTPNPSFLVASRDGRSLYAANEIGIRGREVGRVSAFRVSADGKLTLIDSVASGGANPCDLALDHSGGALLVANCAGGSVALLPVRPDGGLDEPAAVVQHQAHGADPLRQRSPYAHGVAITPDNHFVAVADFGLDQIFLHPFDSSRRILRENTSAAAVVPGGAVRHIVFTPNGSFLYAIDEVDSALTVFRYRDGGLRKLETLSALPRGATTKRGGSELVVDRSGRFLYVSIRGDENKIVVYHLNQRTGHPTPIQFVSTEGIMPRHFALSPDGVWLVVANQNSHSIVWMRRDSQSGRLAANAQRSEQVNSPTCIVLVNPR